MLTCLVVVFSDVKSEQVIREGWAGREPGLARENPPKTNGHKSSSDGILQHHHALIVGRYEYHKLQLWNTSHEPKTLETIIHYSRICSEQLTIFRGP